jgi:hypothetical protein
LFLPLFLIVCYNVIYEKDLILPNFYVYKYCFFYQTKNPLMFNQGVVFQSEMAQTFVELITENNIVRTLYIIIANC